MFCLRPYKTRRGRPRVSKRCDHATARSRKIFQRSRKIWVFERKNAQFTTVLPFLGHFWKKIVCFWPILFAQNFQTEILVAQKKLLLESLLLILFLYFLVLLRTLQYFFVLFCTFLFCSVLLDIFLNFSVLLGTSGHLFLKNGFPGTFW